MKALFLFFAAVLALTFAECPDGFIASYLDKTLCYNFQTNKSNFIDAEGVCIEFGGHLASIHNQFENTFVSEKAVSFFTDSASIDFWVGANAIMTPGTWSWMDGTSFDFTDWDRNQPQNLSDDGCGSVIIGGNGKWESDACYKEKSFVCLTKGTADSQTTVSPTTSPASKSCPLSWNAFNNSCFKVFENMNWLDGESRCKIDGAHLASIHSLEEALFVAHLAYYQNISVCEWQKQAWFGLFTEDSNAHWNWTDGTPFDYSHWIPTQPDFPGDQNCGYILLSDCPGAAAQAGDFDNAYCNTTVSRVVCRKSM